MVVSTGLLEGAVEVHLDGEQEFAREQGEQGTPDRGSESRGPEAAKKVGAAAAVP